MGTQKKPATIYRITNIQNNYVYIGSTVKTIEERLKGHFKNARFGQTSNPMYEDMRNQPEETFKIEKIVTVQWTERWETEKHFTRLAKSYGKCYNIAEGQSRYGENHPNFGKTLSDETKKKLSEANKGQTHSDETKKKMSIAKQGKTHSDETKKKMSAAAKARWAKKRLED